MDQKIKIITHKFQVAGLIKVTFVFIKPNLFKKQNSECLFEGSPVVHCQSGPAYIDILPLKTVYP